MRPIHAIRADLHRVASTAPICTHRNLDGRKVASFPRSTIYVAERPAGDWEAFELATGDDPALAGRAGRSLETRFAGRRDAMIWLRWQTGQDFRCELAEAERDQRAAADERARAEREAAERAAAEAEAKAAAAAEAKARGEAIRVRLEDEARTALAAARRVRLEQERAAELAARRAKRRARPPAAAPAQLAFAL